MYYKENNNMNNYKQLSRAATTEGHFPHQSPPMGRQYVDHSTTFPHVLHMQYDLLLQSVLLDLK